MFSLAYVGAWVNASGILLAISALILDLEMHNMFLSQHCFGIFPLLTKIPSVIYENTPINISDKAKPRVIEGRKATVLWRIWNLSSNVLLEMV